MPELFNFSGGSFPWTRDQLQHIGSDASTNVSEVVLITHQPFRCREGVPDWYFCFSSEDKASLRVAFEQDLNDNVDLLWGVMAGHQHRWYSGLAFDESDFSHFKQWENSAVKGDALLHNMSSSLSVFEASNGKIVGGVRHWYDGNGTGWVVERIL
mmetsp:Transcript_8409/g.12243  ORF Transcript_8409/g.12243 Transcript_8409/m.12243 type:complete len:155 (-) Transcript_8409:6-470(-)